MGNHGNYQDRDGLTEAIISLQIIFVEIHRLPVEILRYDGINKTQRMCQKCNKGDIGDKCHYNTVPILNNKEMRFKRCIHLFM